MRTDYLNPQIYNKLYAVMTYENVLALRISLETGLRIDDVLSLTVNQIIGRTLRGTEEKTGKAYKKAVSADLSDRLKRLRPNKSGFLFPHRTDPTRHRTRQAVWANMKKAARLLGLKMNAAPHSARKTYAVEMFTDKGLEATQKALNHDRMSTTMIYAFSEMLCSKKQEPQYIEIEQLSEIIAQKVVEKFEKKGLILAKNSDTM